MGAYYQEEIVIVDNEKELQKKFDRIVEQCLYDYGHNGYTGTLGEKTELEVKKLPGRVFWLIDEAKKYAFESNDKWGPAWAYQLSENEWLIAGWCSS